LNYPKNSKLINSFDLDVILRFSKTKVTRQVIITAERLEPRANNQKAIFNSLTSNSSSRILTGKKTKGLKPGKLIRGKRWIYVRKRLHKYGYKLVFGMVIIQVNFILKFYYFKCCFIVWSLYYLTKILNLCFHSDF
jgi:hypothetical protein